MKDLTNKLVDKGYKLEVNYKLNFQKRNLEMKTTNSEFLMNKVIRLTGHTKEQIMNDYYNSYRVSDFINRMDGDDINSAKITSTLRNLYKKLSNES